MASIIRNPFVSKNVQSTYWLTRFMMLRLLGAIYVIAFWVAINQLLPLVGSNGLTPVGIFLSQVRQSLGPGASAFWKLPTLFWFNHSDTSLLIAAWSGLVLAILVLLGYANSIVMGLLWLLYLSIVHVGQDWYGYGWEIQILEIGFLSVFLCPLLDGRPFPKTPTPLPIIVLFRWLTFRIMLGAGLIKLRSDQIWKNGTALYYHFETQPLPGPLSRWFHFFPKFVLKVGTWFNWLAELVAPWFLFWPRMTRNWAAAIIILFQLTLILSGNLSFFNWLTILPALACFDDKAWSSVLPA
ncbi:MAG: lipase maturation factor family protein, partial [Bacteroidota bacterium]|nr:lipase maturation factor family protein [Bacteroidota bacterium]